MPKDNCVIDIELPADEFHRLGALADNLCFTDKSIDAFFRFKSEEGVSPKAMASYKSSFANLKGWLGKNRELSAEGLQEWRQYLEESGYSKNTVQGYVKRINDYLRNCGCAAICIQKPPKYNLKGMTFGNLAVSELTQKRNRGNRLWRCKCSCGREIEVITSQLVSGHTRSCGYCSRSANMRYRMRVAEETSIVKALTDDAVSSVNASGYTGVYRKCNKWCAVITYKKKRYHLGVYKRLEDAVRARAEAKSLIMDDGERLEKEYSRLFAQKPTRPSVQPLQPKPKQKRVIIAKNRTDNTGGQRGVCRHRDKWYAKINYKGIRYHLGTYDLLVDAISARASAEECVKNGDTEGLKALHTGTAV